MKKVRKIEPFKSNWCSEAHLGFFADWDEIDQLECGLELGPIILGLRFRWGNRVIDHYEVDKKPVWRFGTRHQNDMGVWHYACAGEDLAPDTILEADLAGRICPPPPPAVNFRVQELRERFGELIYGNVKAAMEIDRYGVSVLGQNLVRVKKGHCFWILEFPMGAEFAKEEG